jgi:hypothetical protein
MLLLLQENQISSTTSKQDRIPTATATAREIAREQTEIGALARHEERIRTDGNCGPNTSGTRNLTTQQTVIGIGRRGFDRRATCCKRKSRQRFEQRGLGARNRNRLRTSGAKMRIFAEPGARAAERASALTLRARNRSQGRVPRAETKASCSRHKNESSQW